MFNALDFITGYSMWRVHEKLGLLGKMDDTKNLPLVMYCCDVSCLLRLRAIYFFFFLLGLCGTH